MSRITRLMGTVSVLATLAAGPAAADTLMGFAGMADVAYTHISVDNGYSSDDSFNGVSLGAAIAFPVEEIANINWQIDGAYSSQSGDDSSRIVWNLGGSLFWAGPQSRTGININYETMTDWGSLTNGGVFTEWYFGNFTAAAKGGFSWGGGTPTGGHGNYLGAELSGYFVPNFALGGSVTWSDLVSGASLSGGGWVPPCFGATCGRRDLSETNFTVSGEFLVSETFPVSIYGGYTYTDWKISENVSNPLLAAGDDFNTNTFFIGLRYYTGGGSLIDHHRNGNLRSWLRGAN